jgi:hypothetical protein
LCIRCHQTTSNQKKLGKDRKSFNVPKLLIILDSASSKLQLQDLPSKSKTQFNMYGQTQLSDSAGCCIYRRQVSDLGMEDPVVECRPKNRNATEGRDPDDSDSAASTVDDLKDEYVPSEEASEVEVDDNEEELDLEDLMSTSTRTSVITRSTSSGSFALRAMSDSFSNSFSFNEYSLTDEVSENCTDSIDEPSKQRVARKLPQRIGSGYVRGDGLPRSNSSPKIRRSLRTSIIKSSNGLPVPAAALREKRRRSTSVAQQIEVRQRSGQSLGEKQQ